MKKAISLYFQPYYFKGTSAEIFKGFNQVDFKTSYKTTIERKRKERGVDPSFNAYCINPRIYTLSKLILNGSKMDVNDARILNHLMANTINSSIKPIVTNKTDLSAEKHSWWENDVVTEGNIDAKNSRSGYISLYEENSFPLSSLLLCNFREYDYSTIVEDMRFTKDEFWCHTNVLTDNDVNDFLSILSKEAGQSDSEFTMADLLEVKWIEVTNIIYGDYDQNVSLDGVIGVVTCGAKFGKLLSMSRARKSNKELRDQVVSYLYNNLVDNNKEEIVKGTDLETLYLMGKREI